MELKMENREILFEKMDAKQKEWNAQVKYLQSRATGLDTETRIIFDNQITNLNLKLKQIEKRTNELKKTSSQVQPEIGDMIVNSWIEVFTKIDDAMLKLKQK